MVPVACPWLYLDSGCAPGPCRFQAYQTESHRLGNLYIYSLAQNHNQRAPLHQPRYKDLTVICNVREDLFHTGVNGDSVLAVRYDLSSYSFVFFFFLLKTRLN